MFWNVYGKRVLCSLRDREALIWTWIFPVILATMFYATFSSLDTVGQLRVFPLGVIDDREYRTALEASGLFEVAVFADTDEADAALEKGEIEGYVIPGGVPALVVTKDEINQTIAKGFLDRYLQAKSSGVFMAPASLTEEISLTQNPPTNKVGYFYALLSMVCLYGAFQGLSSANYLQANLSALGARRALAPAGRFRLIVYDLLGGVTVHFFCLITVVAYIVFVLGTDFGSKLWLVLLTCLAGSMLGVAFGALVAVSSKLKAQAKTAVIITLSMVCCFLSGLMVGGINYIVAEKAPVISWLNPAARISDAFYCLYYYDTYGLFFLNIGIILAMTFAMFLAASVFLRRQRYESI